MKGEGRQHGMVRTCGLLPSPWNPRPHARILNKIDAPPTAGFFTKVSTKPTNHSKCGKPCTECYYYDSYPVYYSYRNRYRSKNKGTQKLISRDSVSVSNHKSLTWRMVDGQAGVNYSGFSATGILNDLDNQYVDEEEDDDDDVDDKYDGQRHDVSMEQFWPETRRDETVEVAEVNDDYEEEGSIMSFFDVGMIFEGIEGDEGWCVLGDVIADLDL
ncbi:uncharacterized protein LOC116123448 [Pistacia vera]|uniref:uncharacterized protein LOC116123448 n=1 Tax=Pistacia vera TaxID=55513 RepID=UPI0012632D97|nr:uncharacterized protein LOC116123448 [Pistacia vera]